MSFWIFFSISSPPWRTRALTQLPMEKLQASVIHASLNAKFWGEQNASATSLHTREVLTPNSRLPRFVRLTALFGLCERGVGAGRLHPAREFLNERRAGPSTRKRAERAPAVVVPMQHSERESPTLATTANAPCASVCRFLPRFYGTGLLCCVTALAYAPCCRGQSTSRCEYHDLTQL